MTPTPPHPEIVAAYRLFTGNRTAQWPCHNFTGGFQAGLASRAACISITKPPTDGDTLTIDGRTFVFREITLAGPAAQQRPLAMIEEERRRQVSVEGYRPEHDDQHDEEELALAAACYACPPKNRGVKNNAMPGIWPWPAEDWKPSTRERDLVKAGALIVAELERIQRAQNAKIAAIAQPTESGFDDPTGPCGTTGGPGVAGVEVGRWGNVHVCQRCGLIHPATMTCEENLNPKDAPITATVAGVQYSTPSTAGEEPPRKIIADLRAMCAALRKQAGEWGETITNLRKELEACRTTLNDVANQRERFRTELAEMKSQVGKEAEAKHSAKNEAATERVVRQGIQARLQVREEQLISQGWKRCPGPAGLKPPVGDRAYWKQRAEVAEAELRSKGWPTPTPKPKPWTLTEVAELIEKRHRGEITAMEFWQTFQARPIP